ncbi:hypothetical protein [Shewanella sp. UCD-KL12]|uniref:hypothetical protein n=1 Tax=Shewanella sp. UCD-KL12 TaxID=1917163 RepID=UPI0009712B56|nr:hypothetical protein [Shewanella sp. UCD-KL12]
MTSSLKTILMLSLFTVSTFSAASDISSIEIDETATADELLKQYEALTEDMNAEVQLQQVEQQLEQESHELLQPICLEYSIDINTGEESCISQ